MTNRQMRNIINAAVENLGYAPSERFNKALNNYEEWRNEGFVRELPGDVYDLSNTLLYDYEDEEAYLELITDYTEKELETAILVEWYRFERSDQYKTIME